MVRVFIGNQFPKLIMVGLSLIVMLPLVVSPETIFPFVVGRTIWFTGILYCIIAIWLILVWVDRSYLPKKSSVILFFAIFVFIQVLAALNSSSPLKGFWSNWERMEGVISYAHWLIFTVIAASTLRDENNWIKILKINTLAGFALAILGLFESFGLVIPVFWGLDLFPLVVEGELSYTLGERLESTIGNPSFAAAYLSLISFSSIGLILRDLQKNYSNSVFETFQRLTTSKKTYFLIAMLGNIIILWAIMSSGSRGSMLGVAMGVSVILIYLSAFYKNIRIASLTILGSGISLLILFIVLSNLMEFQRQSLRIEVLSRYFPSSIFVGTVDNEPLAYEVIEAYPEIVINLDDPEIREIIKATEEVSSDYDRYKNLEETKEEARIRVKELEEIKCTDPVLVQAWLMRGDDRDGYQDLFRECTPIMQIGSYFGSGFSYMLRSGLNLGDRSYAWEAAFKGFQEDPILGIGPENFPILHYKYQKADDVDDKPHLDRAHNRPLHILATSGILGFVSLLLLWGYLLIRTSRYVFERRSENLFWMMMAGLLVCYFSSSLFLFSISSTYLQIVLLMAFLARLESGFPNIKPLTIDSINKGSKESIFYRESTSIALVILIPVICALMIRSYVYIPFNTAKNTPPVGSYTSLTDMQEKVNGFKPLANYGRQEILVYIGVKAEEMLSRTCASGKACSSNDYAVVKDIVDQEYAKAIAVEPDNFNIHFAAASATLRMAQYDSSNLEDATAIQEKIEELGPLSPQNLELKIRIALLRNDPETAEPLIEKWRALMSYVQNEWLTDFWDESLAIVKGEIQPAWEVNCKNDVYPEDKVKFEDGSAMYVTNYDSGLARAVKQEGSGKKVTTGDSIKIEYTGWLADGCIFDSTYVSGSTLTFQVGSGMAIPGFDEGMIGLSKGSKVRLVIPPSLGYDNRGVVGLIPPNATLYFEVNVIEVNP
jgi:FKBP-type peptidyl-prolyl cis-trans isomerase